MKPLISILLAGVVVMIPFTSRSEVITINSLTQSIELPSSIPQDVQDQIRVVIASQEGMFSWVEGFVALAIVVVAGVILYCLWRCSEMIPPAGPTQPPEDPSLAGLLLYNLEPSLSCELQSCVNLDSPQWSTLCTFTGPDDPLEIQMPYSNQRFFRLIPNH